MKLKDLIRNLFTSSRVKHISGQSFADVLRSLEHSIRPISIDGYIRKAETDDFILFGESPRADLWTPIPVRQISELEYLGQEVARDRVCERVRLIL
jgi:hypothetical protein